MLLTSIRINPKIQEKKKKTPYSAHRDNCFVGVYFPQLQIFEEYSFSDCLRM